jgi:hypothetical protein
MKQQHAGSAPGGMSHRQSAGGNLLMLVASQ